MLAHLKNFQARIPRLLVPITLYVNVLLINSKMGPVEPETAALESLEVPVEPRADAVDKSYSPSEAPEALSFSRDHILMRPEL